MLFISGNLASRLCSAFDALWFWIFACTADTDKVDVWKLIIIKYHKRLDSEWKYYLHALFSYAFSNIARFWNFWNSLNNQRLLIDVSKDECLIPKWMCKLDTNRALELQCSKMCGQVPWHGAFTRHEPHRSHWYIRLIGIIRDCLLCLIFMCCLSVPGCFHSYLQSWHLLLCVAWTKISCCRWPGWLSIRCKLAFRALKNFASEKIIDKISINSNKWNK